MKKSPLHQITSTGHKAPDAYFETFDERLFAKMNVQDKMASLKDSGYKVPNDYFENFDIALQLRLEKGHEAKVIRLLSWRNVTYLSGIAAAVAIIFTVFVQPENSLTINQVETASIEAYLNNENLNTYDIASLLNADDLVLEDFVSTTLSEEALENYLLNNTSIEDLIAEK